MRKLQSVVWADADGTGFSPYDPDDEGVPRAFWKAAQRLLTAEVVQPPESLPTTLPHPVWALRRVEVSPLGDFWCFSVQGRGGPFGVAGTCRFSFAEADGWHPAEVWSTAAEQARRDTPDEEPDPELVRQLLAAVLLDRAQIAVPGSPAQVAGLVGALLTRMPRRAAGRWTWATWPLHRPDTRRHRLVAGHWPEKFREYSPNLARQYDQVLAAAPGEDDPALAAALPDRRRRAAFEWLVGPDPDDPDATLVRRSDAVDLPRLVDEIAPAVTVPDWTDVPDELGTEAGRTRLAQRPALLHRWAAERPGPALARLRRLAAGPDPHGLATPLLAGLVETQPGTRKNLLGLPLGQTDGGQSAPESAKWPGQLAQLLVDWEPEPEQRADLLRGFLRQGSVLDDRDRLEALHDWLLDLDLSPLRHPDLFPDRVRTFTTAFRHGMDLAAAAEALAAEPDPGLLMVAVAKRVGRLDPESAAQLLGAMPLLGWFAYRDEDQAHLADTAEILTGWHAVHDPVGVEDWLVKTLSQLHGRIHDRTGERAVAHGALLALLRTGHGPLRDEHLVAYCERTLPASRRPTEFRRLLPGRESSAGADGSYPEQTAGSHAGHHPGHGAEPAPGGVGGGSGAWPERADRRPRGRFRPPFPTGLRQHRLALVGAVIGVVVVVGGSVYAIRTATEETPGPPVATEPADLTPTGTAPAGPPPTAGPVPSGLLPEDRFPRGPLPGQRPAPSYEVAFAPDLDEERLLNDVSRTVAPKVRGRLVRQVDLIGYAPNGEMADRWTAHLGELLRAWVPELAEVPFASEWSEPQSDRKSGTILVRVHFADRPADG